MKQTLRINDLTYGSIRVNVPSWTRWMATDKNGNLYAYAHKPIQYAWGDAWIETSSKVETSIRRLGTIQPPKDWTQELYTWS